MDKKEIKLSIIIPLYNTERYIERCLLSCVEQNIEEQDYEIIVVNDGSTDQSVEVVKRLVEVYKNIRIYSKENGGQSSARNWGLEHANGEYIWFIDSDDWIVPYVIGNLLDKACNYNLDVLGFGFSIAEDNGGLRSYEIKADGEGNVLNGEDFICKVSMPHGPWAAIFRRRYLVEKGLSFIEGIIHEDIDYTMRAYCLADRIMFTSQIAYYYYQREGGIMKSSQSPRRVRDFLTVSDSLYNFAQKNLTPDTPAYIRLIDEVNFAFSQSLANYSNYFSLAIYKEKEYYPLAINPSLPIYTRLKYKLINKSIPFYLFVYKLFRR